MMNKKVVIVTNSSNYEPRAERVGIFFEQRGYDVLWIESDYLHREKVKGRNNVLKHIYIDTLIYKKNMSICRLLSQYKFAKSVENILKRQQIDLLYVLLPANSLAPVAVKIKQKYGTKLVFDIIDLWPESLRLGRAEKLWPFQYWRRLRDDFLGTADLVVTECSLYQDIIRMNADKLVTMYWHKEQQAPKVKFKLDDNCIHIAYLGSINNIIDIDTILELLDKANQKKKVKLHIIGDGEKRNFFLQELHHRYIETNYYGIQYNEDLKKRVFSKCSFGINIMKLGVCVGLTMKSIDYFCYGIPLINNIPGDTWKLVEDYGIGVNYTKGCFEECVEKIMHILNTVQDKRSLIQEIYNQLFTVDAMERVLQNNVLSLLEEEK